MTLAMQQLSLRWQIQPFGGWSPAQRPFPVGWQAQPLTFPQIMDALEKPFVDTLLFFHRLRREHLPDLLQQGWLRLWQTLHQTPTFLARLGLYQAARYVVNHCGSSTFKAKLRHTDSYHALSNWSDSHGDVFEDSITEIVIGSSFKSSGKPGHALFTHRADRLIDIQALMGEMAAWCGDDLRKLAALYYLTTSVTQTDAGRIAGFPVIERESRGPRCRQMVYWTRVVRNKLQEVFVSYRPVEPDKDHWRRCLQNGDVEPVVELAREYAGDAEQLLALYVLTTSVARETAVRELGVNDSALWYAMKCLRKQLRQRYARRVCHLDN